MPDFRYQSEWSPGHKAIRALWSITWWLMFRPSPFFMYRWRVALLRLFGAKIAWDVRLHRTVTVWYPPGLSVGANVLIGEGVRLYNVGRISIGQGAVLSQEAFLCGGTHDFLAPGWKVVGFPIVVGRGAWIAARVFVGPGVKVGEGAVVGACSCVVREVSSWTVVAGNPAKVVRTLEPREPAPERND